MAVAERAADCRRVTVRSSRISRSGRTTMAICARYLISASLARGAWGQYLPASFGGRTSRFAAPSWFPFGGRARTSVRRTPAEDEIGAWLDTRLEQFEIGSQPGHCNGRRVAPFRGRSIHSASGQIRCSSAQAGCIGASSARSGWIHSTAHGVGLPEPRQRPTARPTRPLLAQGSTTRRHARQALASVECTHRGDASGRLRRRFRQFLRPATATERIHKHHRTG